MIDVDALLRCLLGLADELAQAVSEGQPISFPYCDLPVDPGRRRTTVAILHALGVQLDMAAIPAAFRARVHVELERAGDGAREVLGLPPIHGAGKRGYRRLAGRCAGCGCPLDDETAGCRNCAERHRMRRLHARRRAEAGEQVGYGEAA